MQHEHPGNMIRSRMRLYCMTNRKLAQRMDIAESEVSQLLNGHRSVTPAMAVRLSGALDESPYWWAELQMRHDVEKAIGEAAE